MLTAGQSLLLPSGWIHAVFTPCDSCVLGWNWSPREQLGTTLPIVRNSWGPKTHELRQQTAFKMVLGVGLGVSGRGRGRGRVRVRVRVKVRVS